MKVSSGLAKRYRFLRQSLDSAKHHLRPQTSMTSYLERVPPVLLDADVLVWLVAMVTLPRHSGGPPECTGMAEKGGVFPLVLFAGLTGDRQEATHRELRRRICRVMREGRRQVSVPGRSTHPAQLMLAATVHTLEVSCARVPPEHPPPRC